MPYKHFLGYRKGENDEPEVVPEEAEIVRRIYGLFLKGQTPYGIKTSLEAEGIPTPAGKKTWQTATILSILTNEKYKGDALLQKTFCTDFLTKKMKVNEGEVPQYYVENSHPPIVTDEVFNMVQEEIERRRQAGRQHNGTSCFSGRIFCGCCGEMYGSKVWHSTDKYRRVIWQCNAKFKDGHHCGTPHLTEAEIQQRFLKAFNRLLDERTFILEDTAAIMEQLTATAELEAKAENLREEMDVVSELIRQAIEQNASMTMDQAEFEQKYQSLSERFQRAADHLKGIEAECARRAHKRSELEAFIKNLRGREMPIEEFDAMLWMSMVKRVMVEVDGSMRFTFANEMEVII